MSEEAPAQPEPEAEPRWRRILAEPEGKILLAGIGLTVCYLVVILLTRFWSDDLYHRLLSMTGTHVFGGRAAGMSFGYASDLRPWLVILANMVIETFCVLIFYPLFVFSYNRLIVIQPLKETITRARLAAEARQATIVKFGVPGLLLFVWFPFWMTGPLVGSIIGFLIGLKRAVNLTVVLLGTYLAIICWGFVLERIHVRLARIGPYVPFVFVGLILLIAISVHIRYAFFRHPRQGGTGGAVDHDDTTSATDGNGR